MVVHEFLMVSPIHRHPLYRHRSGFDHVLILYDYDVMIRTVHLMVVRLFQMLN